MKHRPDQLVATARSVLQQQFGFQDFRPMQADIITNILQGKDTMVLMPTGGGKSLCYQVPALVLPGVTLVVSPLIALMKDQVERLQLKGLPAAYINSSLAPDMQQTIFQQALEGEIRLLYISPERLQSTDTRYFLQEASIAMVAVDEAHCISSWGHDFRPEYRALSFLKQQFPSVPFVALTATADRITRQDIVQALNLQNPKHFVSSFDRPNIFLQVKQAKQRMPNIISFLEERPLESGVIYCLGKKTTERVAKSLQKAGFSADYYHGGLTAEQRSKKQDRFLYGKTKIICATVAFGMGIDKPNIRFVIHYNFPKSVEQYYQEIGRAGRDGQPAHALLFYSRSDIMAIKRLIGSGEQTHKQLYKLDHMIQFIESDHCRRRVLLQYFNERSHACGHCDRCASEPTYIDGTLWAQKFLSVLARVSHPVTVQTVIDILRGVMSSHIIERGHHHLPTHGVGKDMSSNAWEQIAVQLRQLGYYDVVYHEYPLAHLTNAGIDVLHGKQEVELVALTLGK